jgi:hypothetical protein
MGFLELVFGDQSLQDVRANNVRQCVAESEGLSLADGVGDETLTVKIDSEARKSEEFTRMLNSSRVSIVDLYPRDGAAYLVISVS